MTRPWSIVMTSVMEHCDERFMEHCDDKGMEHCDEMVLEHCDDKGHGAL